MKLSVVVLFFSCMLFAKMENASILQDVNLLNWAKILL